MNRKISTSFVVLAIIVWVGFFLAILWLNGKNRDANEKLAELNNVLLRTSKSGRVDLESLEDSGRQNPDESPLNADRKIGYIKSVYEKNNKRYLTVDYIEWLAGEEAQKAMLEDGQCKKGEECVVFDDYYIRNKDKQIKTLEISLGAQIFMQTLNMEKEGIVWNREVEFDLFKVLFLPGASSRFREVMPFILKIDDGAATKITEQYIP
jgi:hypothetical protein